MNPARLVKKRSSNIDIYDIERCSKVDDEVTDRRERKHKVCVYSLSIKKVAIVIS